MNAFYSRAPTQRRNIVAAGGSVLELGLVLYDDTSLVKIHTRQDSVLRIQQTRIRIPLELISFCLQVYGFALSDTADAAVHRI